MKIAILLPFKDTYTKDKAGSASIWVKDFVKKSKFRMNLNESSDGNLDQEIDD